MELLEKLAVGKGRTPLHERQVAGHDGGGAFVAFGNEFVEVVVLEWRQRFESEIVDDEQRYARQGLKATLVDLGGSGGLQLSQESALCREEDVVVVAHRFMPQGLGDVAFPGTAGSGDEDGHFLLDEAAGGQILDQGLVDTGVEGEIELLEGLLSAKPGSSHAQSEFLLLTTDRLVLNEQREELGVGQLASRASRLRSGSDSRMPDRRSRFSMGANSGMGCLADVVVMGCSPIRWRGGGCSARARCRGRNGLARCRLH